MAIEIEVTYTVKKKITKCWHTCPYFEVDSGIMYCKHSEAEDSGYIIEHPQCRIGFPDKCPLLKKLNKR